jgi:hypothetical protein
LTVGTGKQIILPTKNPKRYETQKVPNADQSQENRQEVGAQKQSMNHNHFYFMKRLHFERVAVLTVMFEPYHTRMMFGRTFLKTFFSSTFV